MPVKKITGEGSSQREEIAKDEARQSAIVQLVRNMAAGESYQIVLESPFISEFPKMTGDYCRAACIAYLAPHANMIRESGEIAKRNKILEEMFERFSDDLKKTEKTLASNPVKPI